MASTVSLNKINGYEFQSYVKKLLSIDKFIFIKIGNETTTSSVYLPERDAVKLANIPTSDLFDFDQELDGDIKVSFYNGSKVVDAISHFKGEVTGDVVYDNIDDANLAADFVIQNDKLKINLACADPSLSFMEMNKEEMSRAFGVENKLFEFDLLTVDADRIKSLFNLEKEEDVFSFSISERGVNVVGAAYDAVIATKFAGDVPVGTKVTAYKKYFNLLDKENYKVIVCENKIVFKSMDTDTLLTVAVAVVDED